ncbi:hypothetical protein V0M98_33995 (plasmid) [Pseudomonas silesiensis]|uniref:hypothetical protein n=1 Tax=Pseudomonas silesiensis TaxID=1853130 RepID=UPI0030D1D020
MRTIKSLHTWKFTDSTRVACRHGSDCEQFANDFTAEYPYFEAVDVKRGFMREEPVFSPYRRAYVKSTVIDAVGPGEPVVYARMEIKAVLPRQAA